MTTPRLVREAWAPHPFVYEINTWPWLDSISTQEGRRVDLGSVPARHWQRLADLGFDAVWLMGVWQRSPAGIRIALANSGLRADFQAALPDWRDADVVGSPYCVKDYVVDDHLGGPAGLAAARKALAQLGIRVILDFVPNHVAPDHPWTGSRPDLFVTGTAADLTTDPTSFVEVAGTVLANGRDPYFPAWPDVVQLNAFAPRLRAAVADTISRIAEQCDGVRCDMAMLVINDVFARTWGDRVGAPPDVEYWPTVITQVRRHHPAFLFIAEAYWGMEWTLAQQGFDYCYDKELYDRMAGGNAELVRQHLLADDSYQNAMIRFVENHDEPRAAATFSAARAPAAAVATLSQTGARLVHDGQMEGRRIRLPVFLGRYPDEPIDDALAQFYPSLLRALSDPTFRHGRWQLCDRSGWPDNQSFHNLVAWSWDGTSRWLIIVNLSDRPATARVTAPWPDLAARSAWQLHRPDAQQTARSTLGRRPCRRSFRRARALALASTPHRTMPGHGYIS